MPKLTVDFSERVSDLLETAAKRNGLSKTDVLRRAIALYDFVDQNVTHEEQGEAVLAINDKSGNQLQRIVLT